MPETWETALRTNYPEAVVDKDFLTSIKHLLHEYGFKNNNTLPCVCLCRDEICCTLRDEIDVQWEAKTEDGKHYARSFTFSALGGFPNVGKTGLGAALGHAPVGQEGRRRYVFFAFPHIGLDKQGELGKLERQGITTIDHACGALLAFKRELNSGTVKIAYDPADAEYSLLKQHLLESLDLFKPESPSLKEITDAAHTVILKEITKLSELIDTEKSDFAVITGIQVHVPHGVSYIQPKSMWIVHNKVKKELHLSHLKHSQH